MYDYANRFWICTDCDKGVQTRVLLDVDFEVVGYANQASQEAEEQFRLDHIGHKIEETDYLA